MLDLTPKKSDLDPIEIASRDEIAALQFDRLRKTLRRSYDNVPHMRAKFEAAGVHPDDCRRLEDLAKFPFTTKADLRDTYPFGMFAVPHDKIARIHASSGTTGKPTVVGYTKADIDVWSDVMARSIRAAGGRAGHEGPCRLRLRPLHRRPRRALRRRAAGLRRHPGFGRHDRAAGAAHPRFQARDRHGDAVLHAGDPRRVPPRRGSTRATAASQVGLFGAEPWTNAMRAEIEQSFDMHAVDIYGLSEVMGPGVASECVETKDGPHIWEDHFYPEIIDPRPARSCPTASRANSSSPR